MHNLHQHPDGSYSFVCVGKAAWHGLGQNVEEAMTAEECAKLGRFDHEIVKLPLVPSGYPGIKTEKYVICRKDGKLITPLGYGSGTYEVLQPKEIFSFFDPIVERSEAIYQTAGVLGKGERYFVTAKLPTDITVGNEQVEGFILLTSGHDGTITTAGVTNIRVVCENTLRAAMSGIKDKVTITHRPGQKDKLKLASEIMGMTSTYQASVQEMFNQMTKVRIGDTQLKEFIISVMEPKKEKLNAEGMKEYSKVFMKKVDGIFQFAHDHETQQSKEAKGTVWGAYNAISGYYSFLKEYDSPSEKMDDIYFNGAGQTIDAAFQKAIALF